MTNARLKNLLVLLLAAAAAPGPALGAAACGSLDDLRARLAAATTGAARSAAVEAFASCAAREGTPLVRPAEAAGRVRSLFAFRSDAARVFLAGDMNGWSTSAQPLEKLPGTDLHVLELDVADGARLDYKLVANGTDWTLDPWNARTMRGGYGPNSELRTPGYVPPADVEPRSDVPQGRYEELTIESRAIGGTRRALVWVPPSLTPESAPVPVLYLLDGLDYREFGRAHTVAANLIASRRLPPFLLVLVPPVDRRVEYENDVCATTAPGSKAGGPGGHAKRSPPGERGAFERYLVTELVPAVERRWNVRRDAEGRGVMGVSLGAFAALSITARWPGAFGRCGAQSTGTSVEACFEALLDDLARLPSGAARFHLDVGTFESNLHGGDLLAISRRLRASLARRQALQYREVPEGHSWGSWRARLAEAWTFFWGDARPPAPGAPNALASPPEGAARFTGEPVSLDVKDADLGDVVRTLTAGRGLSVVAPAELKGTVTATLHDVPWDQALDLVLAGNGWSFVREGTVIRVVRRGKPDR